jgi:hypothetical protein
VRVQVPLPAPILKKPAESSWWRVLFFVQTESREYWKLPAVKHPCVKTLGKGSGGAAPGNESSDRVYPSNFPSERGRRSPGAPFHSPPIDEELPALRQQGERDGSTSGVPNAGIWRALTISSMEVVITGRRRFCGDKPQELASTGMYGGESAGRTRHHVDPR